MLIHYVLLLSDRDHVAWKWTDLQNPECLLSGHLQNKSAASCSGVWKGCGFRSVGPSSPDKMLPSVNFLPSAFFSQVAFLSMPSLFYPEPKVGFSLWAHPFCRFLTGWQNKRHTWAPWGLSVVTLKVPMLEPLFRLVGLFFPPVHWAVCCVLHSTFQMTL